MALDLKHNIKKQSVYGEINNWIEEVKSDFIKLFNEGNLNSYDFSVGNGPIKHFANALCLFNDVYAIPSGMKVIAIYYDEEIEEILLIQKDTKRNKIDDSFELCAYDMGTTLEIIGAIDWGNVGEIHKYFSKRRRL